MSATEQKLSVQVEKTWALLLEQPEPVETYIQKGFQLVAVGFRPFFPALDAMSVADQSTLQSQFCAEAARLAHSMLNSAGMVEDVHNDLWVTATVDKASPL